MAPSKLYVPKAFSVDDSEMFSLVDAVGVGHVVTTSESGLASSFVPLLLDQSSGMIRGHLSRGNDHWKVIADGTEALILVTGVDAYISPSFYPTKADTGMVVPTWNYELVQVRGQARIVDDNEFCEQVVRDLTTRHEASRAQPWSVDDAPRDYIEKMLAAIVGIEIAITGVSGKRKLSQNRPDVDRLGVISGLTNGSAKDQVAAVATPRPTAQT
jgi:transcriptional regulator